MRYDRNFCPIISAESARIKGKAVGIKALCKFVHGVAICTTSHNWADLKQLGELIQQKEMLFAFIEIVNLCALFSSWKGAP